MLTVHRTRGIITPPPPKPYQLPTQRPEIAFKAICEEMRIKPLSENFRRISKAQAMLDAKKIIDWDWDLYDMIFDVQSQVELDVIYKVRISFEEDVHGQPWTSCTCFDWWKHDKKNRNGNPFSTDHQCKHIIAARLFIKNDFKRD